MQVDFPERAGALKRFLAVLCPSFLITLFHYRKTGARSPEWLLDSAFPTLCFHAPSMWLIEGVACAHANLDMAAQNNMMQLVLYCAYKNQAVDARPFLPCAQAIGLQSC